MEITTDWIPGRAWDDTEKMFVIPDCPVIPDSIWNLINIGVKCICYI